MSQLIKIHRLQRAPHLQQLWFLCHLTLVTHLSHMVYGSTEDTNFNIFKIAMVLRKKICLRGSLVIYSSE